MNKKARLEVLSGPKTGTEYPLEGKTIHIGRTEDNDIVSTDNLVSRHHAQITYEEGFYHIHDLDTVNGTFVNKKLIHHQKLRPHDIVQVGNQFYRFTLPSQDQKIAALSSKEPPQRESISKISPPPKPSFRMILYGMGTLLLILLVWIATQSPPLERKIAQQKKGIPPEGEATFETLPSIKKESYLINRAKADRFYESGYREFLSKNYLRAIDDFKTALELYPDHHLANIYLHRTEETISEEIDTHYKAAINYFNSGQYQLSIFHFRTILKLLERRRPPEKYCVIREERQPALENPDYERYCDAQQKIVEAQEYLSSP